MSILVGGSVALDSIESPFGKVENVLGGSASYFAYAASFLTKVHLVGIIGEDFPQKYREILEDQQVDLSAIEVSDKPTFNWSGKYHEDMNIRDTLHVDLSIFEDYKVNVPENLTTCETLCLANMSPQHQLQMIEACTDAKFILADTMDLWINIERDNLEKVAAKVDLLILNDSEAKMWTEEDNIIKAGKKLLEYGPTYVCIKKGEHGATLFKGDEYFVVGAYPLEEVNDPTGAGDCFAGGLAGYLDNKNDYSFASLKEALLVGTTAASFCVEDFSFHKLIEATPQHFENRLKRCRECVSL